MALKKKIFDINISKYTLMLVPHCAKKTTISLCITAKFVKLALASTVIVCLVTGGVLISLASYLKLSLDEKLELVRLRDINSQLARDNSDNQTRIDKMAQDLALLQENMNGLDQLDDEIRKILTEKEVKNLPAKNPQRRLDGGNANRGGPVMKPTIKDIDNLIGDLNGKMDDRQKSLHHLKEAVATQKSVEMATPSIWPTSGEVTSYFGWRSSPWGGSGDWHPGIDIANEPGTLILAAAKGVVTQSAYVGGYGYLIVIDHGNGIETAYGHNSSLLVREGQLVEKGQNIALMGNTGLSTGPHLHYEVRENGTAVNPARFLQD